MKYHGPLTKAIITLNKKSEAPIGFIETFDEYYKHEEVKANIESLLGDDLLFDEHDDFYFNCKAADIAFIGGFTNEEEKQFKELLQKAYRESSRRMKVFLQDVIQLDKDERRKRRV